MSLYLQSRGGWFNMTSYHEPKILEELIIEPGSIKNDGVIKCSDQTQATERDAKIYSGQNDFLFLEIDEKLLKADIVYEGIYNIQSAENGRNVNFMSTIRLRVSYNRY